MVRNNGFWRYVTRYVPDWLAVAVVLSVAVYRLLITDSVRFAGHADKSFYYTTAKNIANGTGLSIPYIWHYLVNQTDLTHYAFDYWMPGASYIFAASIAVFGETPRSIAIVSVISATALSIVTYVAARSLSSFRWVAPGSAIVITFLPSVIRAAVDTETVALYAAIASVALVSVTAAKARPGLWWLAGAMAGLAQLIRNDGILLLITAAIFAWRWAPKTDNRQWKGVVAVLVGYLVVMLPLFAINMAAMGKPLPASLLEFPFLSDYEDLYATGKQQLPPLMDLFNLRVSGVTDRLDQLSKSLGLATALVLSLLWGLRLGISFASFAALDSRWAAPGLFGLLLFSLHAIITPVVSSAGAWTNSLPVLFPFLLIGAVDAIGELVTRRNHLMLALIAIVAFPVAVQTLNHFPDETRNFIRSNNAAATTPRMLLPLLERERLCLPVEVVVMTRNPWEFTEVTGIRSLQIPNNDLDEILKIGERYRATHLLLPAPRAALSDVASITPPNGPFSVVGTVNRITLLRFPGVIAEQGCPKE
jgi:4-amino-4-deoxy-L-arabinose transferase-like glycosyltransferase